jgi:hypothetical protein
MRFSLFTGPNNFEGVKAEEDVENGSVSNAILENCKEGALVTLLVTLYCHVYIPRILRLLDPFRWN